MSVIRWDPFQTVSELQEKINQVFEESFGGSPNDSRDEVPAWKPRVDIYSKKGAIVIATDLPGVRRQDVAVEIRDNIITISGEKKLESKPEDEQYLRKERPFGIFSRAFTLEAPIDAREVRARFKNGVLTVDIPKPTREQPRKIEVSIDE